MLRFAAAVVLGLALPVSAASTVQFASATYRVPENVARAPIALRRAGDLAGAASVDVFVGPSGPGGTGEVLGATFGPGEALTFVAIQVPNDGLAGGPRFLDLGLGPREGGVSLGSRTNAVLQLLENDFGVQLERPEMTVAEEIGFVDVRVVRRDDGSDPVVVRYATEALTAEAGVDFTPVSGSLTLTAGSRVATVRIPVGNDAASEPPETFRFVLSNVEGAALGEPFATTITLEDTDGTVGWRTSGMTVREGASQVRLRLDRGEGLESGEVRVETVDDTAKAGVDYEPRSVVVRFAPGQQESFVDVPLRDEENPSLTRRFRVRLEAVSPGLTVRPPLESIVTLLDDDVRVGLESASISVTADEREAVVSVVRGGSLRDPVTLAYATANGTARSGVNYDEVSGVVTLAPGQSLAAVRVPLHQEPNQTSPKSFTVRLSDPAGTQVLGRVQTTVTLRPAKAGYLTTVVPGVPAEIAREGDRVWASWPGLATVLRQEAVGEPRESLGTFHGPFEVSTVRSMTLLQARSPRPARLFVPSRRTDPLPLVMVLHGYSGSGEGMQGYLQFETLAEEFGVLVCQPDGTRNVAGQRFWNATEACCNFGGVSVDDVGYLRGLLEEIVSRFPVDRRRIYLVGHSNGGFMSYRFALEHPEWVAGVASLAGMSRLEPGRTQLPSAVHVLQVHGTVDPVVPFAGGGLKGLPVDALFPGAVETVESWATLNGAGPAVWDPALSLDLTTEVAGLDTQVTRFPAGPNGGQVELWTIHGGNHGPSWTTVGGVPGFSRRVMEWFLAHPKLE
ncbi:MAG: hypothetical protein J0M24_12870 [Verrucomicrobia bacterium]|nr:hypothetical protein [Verrucomicrobiota bacterium]